MTNKFDTVNPPLSELAQRTAAAQRNATISNMEIPFIIIGEQRWLSARQLSGDPELRAFVERFVHCFEYNPHTDMYLFTE